MEHMNNETKHTPGPWKWTSNYTSSTNEPTWSLIDGTGYGILSCDGIGNSPQGLGDTGHANARLIAAAPELLEAAKEFVRKCECGEARSKRSFQQFKAAITKATGEQP